MTVEKFGQESSENGHDTQKCEKCGGRTALVTGMFIYEPDDETYSVGTKEESKVKSGECWIGGYICDNCGNVQGLWHE